MTDRNSRADRAPDMALNCLAISPTAPVIAAGDYKHIRLWNYETGQMIGQWEAHGFTIEELRFSPDGRKLYSASISGGHGVRIWDVETQMELASPGGRQQASGILELTKDGRVLLTSGLSLWDAEDGSLIRKLSVGGAGATISPDGERIACIDSLNIKIFDTQSGRELATFDMLLPVGQSPIGWKLQFSPDGTRLLAENFDLLMIWDGSPLPELEFNSESSSPEKPAAEITNGASPSDAA